MTTEGAEPVGVFDNEVFQAKYILPQKSAPSRDHPSMKTYISTCPPLGQVTFVKIERVAFTALLEVDESRASDAWEVYLWSSADGSEWKEIPLQSTKSGPTYLREGRQAGTHLCFQSQESIALPKHFTVKFRASSEQSWKWAKDHQGSQDGSVVLKTETAQTSISADLGDYIEDLNRDLEFRNHRSQSPGTTLWEVDAEVEAAVGEKSASKDVVFGVPWGRGKFSR